MITIKSLSLQIGTLVMLSCTANNQSNKEVIASENQSEEWTLLSEGNSLDQWEMYNQSDLKGWELINGELHSTGAGWDAGEDLITKKAFQNFELNLDWKIDSANSSGIFFYVQKGNNNPIYESAPEYQVMDDQGWPEKMKPDQYTAANYAMHAPEGAVVKPSGEWNTTKIIVNYPNVEHWLNGVKVVEYAFGSEDWLARKASGKWADVPDYGIEKSGHIGLQNAGLVTYKNIKIKEL